MFGYCYTCGSFYVLETHYIPIYTLMNQKRRYSSHKVIKQWLNLKVEHFEVTKKWCDCKLQSLLALTTNSYNQQLGPIIGDLCNLVFVIINVLSICSPRLRLILAVSTDTTPSSRVQSYVNRAQNTTHPSGSSVVM